MIAEIPHAHSVRNFHQEKSFRDLWLVPTPGAPT